jgi:hypothetical protein
MLTATRLVLKQHWFEVGASLIVALAAAIAAVGVDVHLRGVDVPSPCFQAWRETFDAPEECLGPLREFATIEEEEAAKVLGAMAILPFLVGLLGGVPLVGREIEARTAQFAWSVTGSRGRWLIRQAYPVIVILGSAVVLAALAADLLETTRQLRSHSGVNDMTLHGWVVVGRAYAAFGLGLLLGAALGRTLPAFIVGAFVSLLLVTSIEEARKSWVMAQIPVAVDVSDGHSPGTIGFSFGVVWLTPEGQQISDTEAVGLVPSGVPDTNQWLLDRGYRMAELVVTEDAVLEWVPYDIGMFAVVGTVTLLAAGVVVNRRRPLP